MIYLSIVLQGITFIRRAIASSGQRVRASITAKYLSRAGLFSSPLHEHQQEMQLLARLYTNMIQPGVNREMRIDYCYLREVQSKLAHVLPVQLHSTAYQQPVLA